MLHKSGKHQRPAGKPPPPAPLTAQAAQAMDELPLDLDKDSEADDQLDPARTMPTALIANWIGDTPSTQRATLEVADNSCCTAKRLQLKRHMPSTPRGSRRPAAHPNGCRCQCARHRDARGWQRGPSCKWQRPACQDAATHSASRPAATKHCQEDHGWAATTSVANPRRSPHPHLAEKLGGSIRAHLACCRNKGARREVLFRWSPGAFILSEPPFPRLAGRPPQSPTSVPPLRGAGPGSARPCPIIRAIPRCAAETDNPPHHSRMRLRSSK